MKSGTCTGCDRLIAVLKDGVLRVHKGPGTGPDCAGAGKPPMEVLPLTAEVLEVVVRRALADARAVPDYQRETAIAVSLQRALAPRLRFLEEQYEESTRT